MKLEKQLANNVNWLKYVRNAHISQEECVRTTLWCLAKGMDFDKYTKAVKVVTPLSKTGAMSTVYNSQDMEAT